MTPEQFIKQFDNRYTDVWSSKHLEFIRIPDGIKGNIKKDLITTIIAVLKEQLDVVGEIDVPYFEPSDIHESGRIVGINTERSRIRRILQHKIDEWTLLLNK